MLPNSNGSPKNSKLMEALARAAFNPTDHKGNEKAFAEFSYEELVLMIPDRNQLCKSLEEIAFQRKADIFRTILFKFRNDEECLNAIIKGFERDNAYRPGSDWGVDVDHADLEKKRAALREVAGLLAQEEIKARPAQMNVPTTSEDIRRPALKPPKKNP